MITRTIFTAHIDPLRAPAFGNPCWWRLNVRQDPAQSAPDLVERHPSSFPYPRPFLTTVAAPISARHCSGPTATGSNGFPTPLQSGIIPYGRPHPAFNGLLASFGVRASIQPQCRSRVLPSTRGRWTACNCTLLGWRLSISPAASPRAVPPRAAAVGLRAADRNLRAPRF